MILLGGIKLPELLEGREFEEYLAAYFQETGNYLEKHIIERHSDGEVLEIDLALTDYDKNPLEMKLVEAKSGKCKFTDVFKIRGWMYYLNFNKGIFISQIKSNNFDFQREIAKKIDVDVVQIGDLSNTSEALKDINGGTDFDEEDIHVWRYTYWIERALLNRLDVWRKSVKEKECYQQMYNYHFKTHDDVFFTKNIIQRLSGLYDTFYKTPRLTAHVANELDNKSFKGKHFEIPPKIFRDYFWYCKYTPLQISTYIEYNTRLSIFKNAVDYKLLKDSGDTDLTENGIVISKLLGIQFESSLLDNLPTYFVKNLNSISEDEYFNHYPIFWQVFLWLFGGFILNDYKEQDYELLSKKSGIPIDEIPNAFESYNKIFPNKNGWFWDLKNSNIMIMKMFPMPFSGIGAHYRKVKYTEKSNFEDLDLTGHHTLKDLSKWNNLAYNVLKEDLKLN